METQIDSIQFYCKCGKLIRARVDQCGRSYSCPGCGNVVAVPKVAMASERQAGETAPTPPPGTRVHEHGHTIDSSAPRKLPAWLRVPTTIGELLVYIGCAWLIASVGLLILSLLSTVMGFISGLLFLALTAGTAYQVFVLMRARQRVLVEKDIPLLWGAVRLVAWDPIEGVLFLMNKSISFYDDSLHDGRGGVRLIYPCFGEELALRVPLEVQTLQFLDNNVMTREYLSVTVHGTLKWRLIDIRKFYLLLSRELRNTTDEHKQNLPPGDTLPSRQRQRIPSELRAEADVSRKLNLAIMWLRVLAEEQTRTIISRISSGLLIADRLADEMPEIKAAVTRDRSMLTALAAETPNTCNDDWTGAADGLARSIYDSLGKRVTPYGICVEEVSLQEIKLPPEIVRACVEAAQTAYLPLLAQRRAAADVAAKRANLAAEVELLGREAVGMRQVVGAAPAFTLADFLSNFISKGLNAQAAAGLAVTAATVGVAGQLPAAGSTTPTSAVTHANISTDAPPAG